MKKIGITGAIGSGKSTAAKIFRVLGVPVYDADSAAKRLMTEDTALREQLIHHFGADTYLPDGSLNRAYLANKVFGDQTQLNLLNSLVHPAVLTDGERWMERHLQYPYVVKEAALLLESGSYKVLDELVCVVAPEQVRIQRVMQRDGVEEAAVRARMEKQWSQEEKASASQHIIVNDGIQPLIPQVMALHQLWQ